MKKTLFLFLLLFFLAWAPPALAWKGSGSRSIDEDSEADSQSPSQGDAAFSPLFALSANLGSLASRAVSIEASAGVSRHWSADASVRYNPFSEVPSQRSFALGGRYWPWYVYSGMWLSGKARYQEYRSAESEDHSGEGDRYGGSFSLGYSRMLSRHLNLDFGLGVWGGYETYSVYDCGTCGSLREKGQKYFLRADELVLSLTYVF